MEAFDFSALLPPEVRARVAQIKDPARRVLENKVRAYNELPGAEDGSGVNCPACRNKGYVAVLDEDGPRMVVRYCACRSRRTTALRLKACGMLDRAKLCSLQNSSKGSPTSQRLKSMTPMEPSGR